MTSREHRNVQLRPELVEPDLQRLHSAAVRNPHGPEDRLLRVTLNALAAIKSGAPSTHSLEYMPTYPDLSDCETSYIGTDPNTRPSHRLVWRERVPEDPREPAVREIIALGERDNGQVYHLAGQRLGRPVGFTLDQLAELREPVHTAQPDVSHHHGLNSPAQDAEVEPQL